MVDVQHRRRSAELHQLLCPPQTTPKTWLLRDTPDCGSGQDTVTVEVQTLTITGFKFILCDFPPRKPRVSSTEMDLKMAGRRLVALSQLPERLTRDKLEDSDWVTFAVLVNKSTPQSSSSVGSAVTSEPQPRPAVDTL